MSDSLIISSSPYRMGDSDTSRPIHRSLATIRATKTKPAVTSPCFKSVAATAKMANTPVRGAAATFVLRSAPSIKQRHVICPRMAHQQERKSKGYHLLIHTTMPERLFDPIAALPAARYSDPRPLGLA